MAKMKGHIVENPIMQRLRPEQGRRMSLKQLRTLKYCLFILKSKRRVNSFAAYAYGLRPSHLLACKNSKLKNTMAICALLQRNPAEVDAAVNTHVL